MVLGSVEIVDSSFSFGLLQLVGHGRKTNDNCGVVRSYYGCVHVESHDIIASDGKNHKGEVFVRKVVFSCDKPSCPVCYKFGWAGREAHKIEVRLAEAGKRFGLVEHIVASVPVRDYGLSYEVLRVKAVKTLFSCGVVGGVLIFHGFRYNDAYEAMLKHVPMGWYWSPHFHVLGFIFGGYSRCRHCKGGNCYACDGFEGRVYRCYRDNGYIISVKDERKTVGGTAWYQLNHATIKKGVERFHVATWFGVCSYRRLKVTVERKKLICPICERDLEKLRYNGNRFVMDENLSSGKRKFFAKAVDECGIPLWVVDAGVKRVW